MLARLHFRNAAVLRSSIITHTRGFNEIPKPDPTKPVPWRSVLVRDPKDPKAPAINVNVYSTGKGLRPPAPIVCIHGITSNSRYFSSLVRELNYPYGVLSVDLRGRGDSEKPASGQHGLRKHAEDIIRVLDHFHLIRAFVVGHSMGALVAYQMAKHFPNRISGLAMIDSGFYRDSQQTSKSELPEGVKEGVAKAMSRLGREFASLEEYLEFWYPGQGVTPSTLSVDMLDYYQNELLRTDGGFTPKPSRVSADDDSLSVSKDNLTLQQLTEIQHPTIMLRAEHGFVDNTPPMIRDDVAQKLKEAMNIKKDIKIPGTNHYTILTKPESVKRVAKEIDAMISQYDVHEKITAAFEEMKPREGENVASSSSKKDKKEKKQK